MSRRLSLVLGVGYPQGWRCTLSGSAGVATWSPIKTEPFEWSINASQAVPNDDLDYRFKVDSSGGVRTLTLPASPTHVGKVVWAKRLGGNTVTFDGNGKTIDGAATLDITSDKGVNMIRWNGTTWDVWV